MRFGGIGVGGVDGTSDGFTSVGKLEGTGEGAGESVGFPPVGD
jgi:hypothetical protein